MYIKSFELVRGTTWTKFVSGASESAHFYQIAIDYEKSRFR